MVQDLNDLKLKVDNLTESPAASGVKHPTETAHSARSSLGTPRYHSRTPIYTPSPVNPMSPFTTGEYTGAFGSYSQRTGSTARGHRRTRTPVHNKSSNGSDQKQNISALKPQDDRPLIADFFDDIAAWANLWSARFSSPKDVSELVKNMPYVVVEFLGRGLQEPPLDLYATAAAIVTDDHLRPNLVAGIVTMYVVYYTMEDGFLNHSSLLLAVFAEALVEEFESLEDHEAEKKHEVLVRQQQLYTFIKERPGHRKTRSIMANKLSNALVAHLGPLLRSSTEAPVFEAKDRNFALQDLFVRGYRIGFRMHMEPARWAVSWPLLGKDFDTARMINMSRNLHGHPTTTYQRVMQAPGLYTVRFGTSPVIAKEVYGEGKEGEAKKKRMEVVHHAEVHVEKKISFIGAERKFSKTLPNAY